MPNAHDQPTAVPLSRRGFLAGAVGALTMPALLSCGREQADVTPGGDVAAKDPPVPIRPPLPATEPVIRVRVKRAKGRVTLADNRQWLTVGPTDRTGGDVIELQGPVDVEPGAAGWAVRDARGRRFVVDGLDPIELTPREPQGVIDLGELTYPGTMRLVARTDVGPTNVDVINLVPMELYLPGVVASELFAHWKLQTRAAQAIAARSFAASEHAESRRRRHFDVTATDAAQVYKGIIDHGPTHEAVEMTRGVVLAWEDRLVSGYYSACCGGLAASAVDVIGRNPINNVPPLWGRQGEDVCTGAKIARWTVQRPADQLLRRLARWGKRRGPKDLARLADLAAIDIVARNQHGRPTRFAFRDSAGLQVELAAERLRQAANSSSGLGRPERRLWSSFVEATVRKGNVTFRGHGHGHGAGLCQYGAETLARRGKTHEQIIAWYYPGAKLVRAY